MPLVAAAVLPHPPLLVPELASGAAPELNELRAGCAKVLSRLLEARPDRVLIIGSGPEPSAAELGRPDLPLSVAVGQWLLDRAGAGGVSSASQTVSARASVADCRRLGESLAATPDPIALAVMGDGSACRGPKAPGYDDPRAAAFDKAAAAALGSADTSALLDIDRALAGELLCAGRAPWQVLAAAVAADGRVWQGDLLYDAAPYGVAYFVAHWAPEATRAGQTRP